MPVIASRRSLPRAAVADLANHSAPPRTPVLLPCRAIGHVRGADSEPGATAPRDRDGDSIENMSQNDDYEYRGLMAEAWDLLRGDTSTWPDRSFYRDTILHSGQPALDVGCGNGRLLLDFLATGIDIDGVDNSPQMLALCRDKAHQLGLAPHIYEQRMEDLALPRTYRTMIVPSSSFQLVTDPVPAAQAMARFFAHLEPGGTLVMPFMVLWRGTATSGTVDGEWEQVGEATRPGDGAEVRRWSRAMYDIDNQLEHTEDRYEIVRDGAVIASEHNVRSPATRWYTQQQASALYREAGFYQIRLVHEFTEEPARPDDRIFCVFGTRSLPNSAPGPGRRSSHPRCTGSPRHYTAPTA